MPTKEQRRRRPRRYEHTPEVFVMMLRYDEGTFASAVYRSVEQARGSLYESEDEGSILEESTGQSEWQVRWSQDLGDDGVYVFWLEPVPLYSNRPELGRAAGATERPRDGGAAPPL
jgi:hypothetical protein